MVSKPSALFPKKGKVSWVFSLAAFQWEALCRKKKCMPPSEGNGKFQELDEECKGGFRCFTFGK